MLLQIYQSVGSECTWESQTEHDNVCIQCGYDIHAVDPYELSTSLRVLSQMKRYASVVAVLATITVSQLNAAHAWARQKI